MTALLSLIGPQAIGILAAVVALIGVYIRGRMSGANLERAKQASAEAKARDIADQVDNDLASLPGSKARDELGKWAQ